jgi:glycosyltransferase involved in cell wall biosynthesis
MKILEVIDGCVEGKGGVPTVVKSLSASFAELGENCTILETGGSELEKANGHKNLKIVSMGVGQSIPFMPIRLSLLKAVNEYITTAEPPDIVHFHGFHSPQILTMIHMFRKYPIVFSTHFHGRGHTPLTQILFPFYLPYGSLILRIPEDVIAVSEYEKSMLQRYFPHIKGELKVIPNGVQFFNPNFVRKPFSGDTIHILTIARLQKYKGIQYVMRALKEIKKLTNMSIIYTIVGDGPDRKYLEDIAEENNISDSMIWLRNISDQKLREVYHNADVFILLSEAEAYGLVVAEALSLGIPCVLSKGGALSEFKGSPGCSIIEDSKSLTKISEAIIAAIKQSKNDSIGFDLRKIRGWDEVAKEHLALFKEIALRKNRTKSEHL